jgi:outer membrane protein assembly factor BamB
MRLLFTALIVCLFVRDGGAADLDQSKVRATAASRLAERIVKASGVKAGLCVHVGVTDGELTAGLRAGGRFVVHGLAADAASVEKARDFIRKSGQYGDVSVERVAFAKLPYADNLVNLLVVDDPKKLGLDEREIRRVLVPNGVAVVGSKDFRIIRKPRPKGMDDWTHPRHGPDGNPVSLDTLAGPSPQLRWLAGPLWGHHRGPAGAVTANGRLFCVLREAPLGTAVPPRFYLTAHDAYNGILLWKRPVPGRKVQYGHSATVPSGSLVASGDRVFVVLKAGTPLVALDAATGETVMTYKNAPSPASVLYHDGTLVLAQRTNLHVVDAATGKLLWQRAWTASRARNVWTTSPAVVGGDDLFFLQGAKRKGPLSLVGAELKTGKERWRKDVGTLLPAKSGGPALVSHYKGLVLLRNAGGVHAVSAKDGALRWSKAGASGYVFGLRGLVWAQAKGIPKDAKYGWIGLDPADGKQKAQIGVPKALPKHIRGKRILDGQCNFSTATERYIVTTTRMSLVDTQTGEFHNTMITRAPCKFLLAVPANGLLYTFPKDCNCYPCLRGMLAYSPAPADAAKPTNTPPLEKGVAFGTTRDPEPETRNSSDWPTYRHDGARSNSTPGVVPAKLSSAWSTEVGGKLTAPVVAEGKVFVASVERHTVHALDAQTGRPAWIFTAGGRVNSPPTIYRRLCLFGSRDGWVYCLRAKDGVLVWRLRAAPAERRIVAFGQVESAWPTFGSVLVKDGVASFSAGHHANAEGGIQVYGVEPATGKFLWRNAPSYEIVNDVLQITPKGNVYLGYYKVAFDLKTGRAVRDQTRLRTSFAGFLNDEITRVLPVFDSTRTVAVYRGKLDKRKRRRQSVPGRGFDVVLSITREGKPARVWSREGLPVRINAVVLTKDVVFVAGPVDARFNPDAKDPYAVIDGGLGGTVLALSAADGKLAGELNLPAPPVLDGMAAAGGRLYMATRDGKVRCFEEEKK